MAANDQYGNLKFKREHSNRTIQEQEILLYVNEKNQMNRSLFIIKRLINSKQPQICALHTIKYAMQDEMSPLTKNGQKAP